ncbi:MAG: bifunctional adenosylcobinamide kinase/adenosylcobinamide-phosphate guanylyltransferase [Pseudomonadota bacterium]|nr:bifunctional adenosylcobinamide kinase/adenosylcobinamide-phosphate guanylyltransferase [Pseudomonadota bacterium]
MARIELILGGARSGKSRYAEEQAQQSGRPVVYIATATAQDGEMAQRIHHHQQRRPAEWQTLEEPLALAQAIQRAGPDSLILVDCLTLWLTNCLLDNDPEQWALQRKQLLTLLASCPADLLLVSNEVGGGVVPMGELSRRFVDEAGWLHQAIAAQASDVTLVVAGIPLAVKRSAHS